MANKRWFFLTALFALCLSGAFAQAVPTTQAAVPTTPVAGAGIAPAPQSPEQVSAPQAQAGQAVTQPQTAPPAPVVIAPEGLDHMTLAAFCQANALNAAEALAKLKAKGIVAFSDMTFRELAIENNLTAQQVMDLMTK